MLTKPDTKDVKVLNAALEERANGDIILRGSIDVSSLKHLRTDDYQREVLVQPGSRGGKSKLRRGIEKGSILPDIELGMRGQKFTTWGSTVTLHNDVYIIDGLQRVSAMLAHLDEAEAATTTNPLGAVVHFATDKTWEKERFAELNSSRIPVSPNVLLRNARDEHPSLLTLYGLSFNDPAFPLYQRVCWKQRMAQSELISASSLLQSVRSCHRHVIEKIALASGKAPGNRKGNAVDKKRGPTTGAFSGSAKSGEGPTQLDKVAQEIGLGNFRGNIKAFFELIDKCFGIRTVEHNQVQGHLRRNFLMVLGAFLSNNPAFWQASGRQLRIPPRLLKRIRAFKIQDPEIRRLAAAGTMVIPTLYNYLLIHMNKRERGEPFR